MSHSEPSRSAEYTVAGETVELRACLGRPTGLGKALQNPPVSDVSDQLHSRKQGLLLQRILLVILRCSGSVAMDSLRAGGCLELPPLHGAPGLSAAEPESYARVTHFHCRAQMCGRTLKIKTIGKTGVFYSCSATERILSPQKCTC